MRFRFTAALIIILLASINIFGQGIITPRRHKAAKEKAADTTQPALPEQGEKTLKPLPGALPVSSIKINLQIEGQLATVRVAHLFRNETDEMLEGTYYFPVPESATLLEFAVYDGDEKRTGRVKEKEEARAAFASAAASGEDPAILEMTRRGWFQSHVYPIPPHADKRIEIVYSQILSVRDGVAVFEYPLGQGYRKLKTPVGNVEIEFDLKSKVAIRNVFSPTHPLDLKQNDDRHISGAVKTVGGEDAENFQLLYSLPEEEFNASLITFRREGEDGYFLMMISPKVEFDAKRMSGKDVVFVIDISGSMAGEKLHQAKDALKFGLTRTLGEADRFNIIAFSSGVQSFSQTLLGATRSNIAGAVNWVDGLTAQGGTNINDALVTAMKMVERGLRAQNVVFLTDGQASGPVSDPNQIAINVRVANQAQARLFTFGVGHDVNRLLLERLAADNRGSMSDIANQSKLEQTVSSFFGKVSQSVLANLQLDFGLLHTDRLQPSVLPDLYTKSQIKIFGRYKNAHDLRDITVALTGLMNEEVQRFEFSGLDFPLVTENKDFLPKLWATERVQALLAEIRLYGEKPELKQEVIEIAREFNLITPYTSMYVPTTAEMGREKGSETASVIVPAGAETVAVTAGREEVIQRESSQISSNFNARKIASLPPSASSGVGTGNGSGVASNNRVSVDGAQVRKVDQLPINGRTFSNIQALSPPPQGTVVDATGAVIPNATVTLKDQNTGASRTVITDSSGNYSVAGLPPGNYKLEVDAAGFKKTVVENIAVQPGQVAATGVQLSVASATETVTVTSVATAIDTTTSGLSSNYEWRIIRDLPSLAPVDALARLVPGASSLEIGVPNAQSPGTDRTAEFQFWLNGIHPRSNSFSLDGHDNNSIDGRPTISINNFDAVDTLNVMTTRSSGDVSLTGATSINLITRSGTNEFHGSAFDYQLGRRFGALSPLERRSGLQEPPRFNSHLYGGSLGGPFRRDRAFFFGAFQGEYENSQRFIDSTSSALALTSIGREQLMRAFPNSSTVRDIAERGALARTMYFLQAGRRFTLPVLGVPVDFSQTTRITDSKARGYEGMIRLDFNLTRRDSLKVGYWHDNRTSENTVGRLAAGYPNDADARSQLASLRWNRALAPRTTNEIAFTFNRSRASLESTEGSTGLSVNPGLRSLAYGNSPFTDVEHVSNLFEVSEVLSHISGRHNLKLGGQFRRRLTRFDYLPGSQGNYSYLNFEDFVLDQPTAITVAVGSGSSNFSQSHHHYFIDDTWRVNRDLTLTFGLSYENAGQPVNGLIERIRERESNPATALFEQTPALLNVIRDNNNFAPRIGFAFTPTSLVLGRNIFGFDKTVVRGGVSISYDQTAYRPLADIAASAPNILLGVIIPGAGATLPAFPHVPGASELLSIFGGDSNRFARTRLARDYRTPFATVWHLTISRDVNERLMLETGYTGSRGVGLIRTIDGNAIIDGSNNQAGPLRIYETTGRSLYHSFQFRADLRVTNQIQGSLAYTFSKLIDDVPVGNAQIVGGAGDVGSLSSPQLQAFAQNPFDTSRGERGLSSLHRSHAITSHFVWTLPVYRGQSGVLRKILEGWKASGIVDVSSGSPFTPLQYIGYSPASSASFAAILSDRLGGIRPFAGSPVAPADTLAFSNAANALYKFFLNPDGTPFVSSTGFIIAHRGGFTSGLPQDARFIYNDYSVELAARRMGLAPEAFGKTFAAGRPFGDVGRNTLIGPWLANVDFALLKTTKLTEKVSLQFRAEAYNLFNRANRVRPNSIVENAGGFGYLDYGEVDTIPRRLRFALKLIF